MTEQLVALLEQVWKETPHAKTCRMMYWRAPSAGFRSEPSCNCDWAQRVREKIARASWAAMRAAAVGPGRDYETWGERGLAAFEEELGR